MHGASVAEVRWFYRNADEWNAFAQRLKLIPCPHCKVVGMLIKHGSLYGYDEGNSGATTVRAQRVFCSNRNKRRGCGRTFSVWLAHKIRRLSLSTRTLHAFLRLAVAGTIVAAIAAVGQRSARTWQRIWRRFNLAQSKIRTALSARCPPPELPATELPATPSRRPTAHVLAHLQAAFKGADPVASFQHTLRTFFV